MQISIDAGEYNKAAKAITNANDRSLSNKDNFTMTFEKSNAASLTNYSDSIKGLKDCLSAYGSQLQVDISGLNKIRDEVQALDTSMAK